MKIKQQITNVMAGLLTLFASLVYAQDAPPAGTPYFSMKVTENATVRVVLLSVNIGETIWVETKPGTFVKGKISYIFQYFTADGNELKFYGNFTSFNCVKNIDKIKTLDFSHHPGIALIDARSNGITDMDVSKVTALEKLHCSQNKLSSLDVSKNAALSYLDCASNALNTIDVSKNSSLKVLKCSKNQLNTLDVSQNDSLLYLFCGNNKLGGLSVNNMHSLEHLRCDTNRIQNLDVSNNAKLKYLFCNSNEIQALDISHNPKIKTMFCNNNKLMRLNMANGANLSIKHMVGQSKAVDVSGNPSLLCVQVDVDFTPPSTGDDKWVKDEATTWSQTPCELAIGENDLALTTKVWATNGHINISMAPLGATLMVADIMGRQLLCTTVKQSSMQIAMPKGFYLLSIDKTRYKLMVPSL